MKHGLIGIHHGGDLGKSPGLGKSPPVDGDGWKVPQLYGCVWKCCVPLNPVWLTIIIPIKWLFHWEYTLFSDKPIQNQWFAQRTKPPENSGCFQRTEPPLMMASWRCSHIFPAKNPPFLAMIQPDGMIRQGTGSAWNPGVDVSSILGSAENFTRFEASFVCKHIGACRYDTNGFVWKRWVNIPNEIAIFHRDNDQQNHWVYGYTIFRYIQIMCNYEKTLYCSIFFPQFDLGMSFHIANCGFMTTIPTTEFNSKWSQQFQRSCTSKHRVCHKIWINMKYINPSHSKTWLQSLIWIDFGVY